jgi:hypothetical protein
MSTLPAGSDTTNCRYKSCAGSSVRRDARKHWRIAGIRVMFLRA